jgi:hypothetical protein
LVNLVRLSDAQERSARTGHGCHPTPG